MGRPTQATIEKREAKQQEMITAAVTAALAGSEERMRAKLQEEILAQLASAKEVAGAPTAQAALQGVHDMSKAAGSAGDKAFANVLALAIAEMTSQA